MTSIEKMQEELTKITRDLENPSDISNNEINLKKKVRRLFKIN